MNNWMTYINILAIIIVGAIGFYAQLRMAIKIHQEWRWIKIGLSVISLLWVLTYSFVMINFLLGIDDQSSVFFRNWIIRPMILLTVSFIAASGIARSNEK